MYYTYILCRPTAYFYSVFSIIRVILLLSIRFNLQSVEDSQIRFNLQSVEDSQIRFNPQSFEDSEIRFNPQSFEDSEIRFNPQTLEDIEIVLPAQMQLVPERRMPRSPFLLS